MGNDLPTAVVVSPDGSKAFETGSSIGQGGFSDYSTVAYEL
jgi:hypothetical protein